MGSNGSVPERLRESEAACQVLGAAWRENLGWPDRGFGKNSDEMQQAIALVRRARPRTVAMPYWADRHPDHVVASHVLTEAVFNAGLRRYRAEGEPWKVEWICYYFINDAVTPSFVVDVTDHYQVKRRALDCHTSQFAPPADTVVATRLNTPLFRQLIESRDAQFGALAGVRWAEGFVVREPVLRTGLFRSPA